MEAHNASFLHYNGIYDKTLAPVLKTDVTEFLTTLGVWRGLVLLVCLYWGGSSLSVRRRIRVPNTPIHGYRSWFEPTFLLQLRYARDAHKIISSGYEKVCLIATNTDTEMPKCGLPDSFCSTKVDPLSFVVRISTLPFFQISIYQNFVQSQTQNSVEEKPIPWLVLRSDLPFSTLIGLNLLNS